MDIDRLKALHAEMGLLLTGGAIVTPEPEPLPGIPVTDRAALDVALKTATGGEVFRLSPGDYGSLAIQPQFDDPVTIIGGTFSSIKTSGKNNQSRCKGLILDSVTASYIDLFNIDNAQLLRSKAYQVNVNQADGFLVERCWIYDGHFPLRILRSRNGKVTGNIMEGTREDTMRISGDSSHIEVRGNVFRRNMAAKPKHGDHLQIFGLPKEKVGPKNIVIEQNLFHDCPKDKEVFHVSDGTAARGEKWKAGDKATPAGSQGVFIGDGAGDFENITIRHNLFRLALVNAIASKSGPVNFVVAENIIVPMQVPGYNIARIHFDRHENQPNWSLKGVTVTRNVTPLIDDRSNGEATIAPDNFVYGADAKGLFEGITDTDGTTGDQPEHYRLAAGSKIPAELVEPWLEGMIAVIRKTLDTVDRAA